MKHTPVPWKNDCFLITAANGREVAHTGLLGRRRASYSDQSGGEEDEANAEFIAVACSNYAKLLAALEACDVVMATARDHGVGDILAPAYRDSWELTHKEVTKAIAAAKETTRAGL